ncbi:hypothetical protein C8R43DRAFT_1115105 [Mycena crocata]|nr:hypothetical protein C8R43DRAFT_1115105 [Mycena crocata]
MTDWRRAVRIKVRNSVRGQREILDEGEQYRRWREARRWWLEKERGPLVYIAAPTHIRGASEGMHNSSGNFTEFYFNQDKCMNAQHLHADLWKSGGRSGNFREFSDLSGVVEWEPLGGETKLASAQQAPTDGACQFCLSSNIDPTLMLGQTERNKSNHAKYDLSFDNHLRELNELDTHKIQILPQLPWALLLAPDEEPARVFCSREPEVLQQDPGTFNYITITSAGTWKARFGNLLPLFDKKCLRYAPAGNFHQNSTRINYGDSTKLVDFKFYVCKDDCEAGLNFAHLRRSSGAVIYYSCDASV